MNNIPDGYRSDQTTDLGLFHEILILNILILLPALHVELHLTKSPKIINKVNALMSLMSLTSIFSFQIPSCNGIIEEAQIVYLTTANERSIA